MYSTMILALHSQSIMFAPCSNLQPGSVRVHGTGPLSPGTDLPIYSVVANI